MRQTRINAGWSGNLPLNWRFSPDALNRLLSQKRTLPTTGGDEVLVGSGIRRKARPRGQRGSWCYKRMADRGQSDMEICHSRANPTSDCGCRSRTAYTILSGQTRARGLCISAKGTVGEPGRGVSIVPNAANKGCPFSHCAHKRPRRLHTINEGSQRACPVAAKSGHLRQS